MSSHKRKTTISKSEKIQDALDLIKGAYCFDQKIRKGLLDRIEDSLALAKKNHKVPIISESMMMSAKAIFAIIEEVYNCQDKKYYEYTKNGHEYLQAMN